MVVVELIGSLFILFTVDLPDFAFLSQNSNINKTDIKIIHCCLSHLYIDNIMKLASMSIGLEITNSMTQSPLFCEICVPTEQVEITYKKSDSFFHYRYINSDWTMDPITRCSTIGYLFTITGGVINASLKCWHSVTLSSTKAEYVVYCQASKEAVWLRLLLKEFGYS